MSNVKFEQIGTGIKSVSKSSGKEQIVISLDYAKILQMQAHDFKKIFMFPAKKYSPSSPDFTLCAPVTIGSVSRQEVLL